MYSFRGVHLWVFEQLCLELYWWHKCNLYCLKPFHRSFLWNQHLKYRFLWWNSVHLFFIAHSMCDLKNTFRNVFSWALVLHIYESQWFEFLKHYRLQRTNLSQHDERADNLHNKKHIEEWLDLHIWIWNWWCWFYKSVSKCTCAML